MISRPGGRIATRPGTSSLRRAILRAGWPAGGPPAPRARPSSDAGRRSDPCPLEAGQVMGRAAGRPGAGRLAGRGQARAPTRFERHPGSQLRASGGSPRSSAPRRAAPTGSDAAAIARWPSASDHLRRGAARVDEHLRSDRIEPMSRAGQTEGRFSRSRKDSHGLAANLTRQSLTRASPSPPVEEPRWPRSPPDHCPAGLASR